jgi:hypothetical protein
MPYEDSAWSMELPIGPVPFYLPVGEKKTSSLSLFFSHAAVARMAVYGEPIIIYQC